MSINILDSSDRDVRVVDRGDNILMGALTKEGMLQLTSLVDDSSPRSYIKKVYRLMKGEVYMIELHKPKETV